MKKLSIFALCAAVMSSAAPAASPAYAEGQVWQYRARPGEEGSLLKIQRIEVDPAFKDRVFHISIVGFRLRNPQIVPMLPHAPVSRETLDMSVTNLVSDPGGFPPADAGIAEWRAAEGGVYTVSVAQIVEMLDTTTADPANIRR